MKIVILLLFAIIIPFPLCLFRMKKYEIPFWKMLIIYAAFSTVGFIGARFGPGWVGIELSGIRLYGLVLLDVAALYSMSKALKINIYKLGDFVAPPIMAVCASAKINCLLEGCCKGFIMGYAENKPVFFPSAIFEMIIWFVLVALLLVVEKRKRVEGLLWPILMIWFGVVRYLVDFLRGSALEQTPYFLWIPPGRFWSIVTLMVGLIFLYRSMWKISGNRPEKKAFLKAVFGL